MIKHILILLCITTGLSSSMIVDKGRANILDDHKDQWEKVMCGNEIDVYKRQVDGMPFDEFMAVGMVHARLETLIELIREADCEKWAGDCIGSKIVTTITPFEKIVYFKAKVLWYKTLMGVRKEAKQRKYIELGKKSSEKPLIDAYFDSVERKKNG